MFDIVVRLIARPRDDLPQCVWDSFTFALADCSQHMLEGHMCFILYLRQLGLFKNSLTRFHVLLYYMVPFSCK